MNMNLVKRFLGTHWLWSLICDRFAGRWRGTSWLFSQTRHLLPGGIAVQESSTDPVSIYSQEAVFVFAIKGAVTAIWRPVTSEFVLTTASTIHPLALRASGTNPYQRNPVSIWQTRVRNTQELLGAKDET